MFVAAIFDRRKHSVDRAVSCSMLNSGGEAAYLGIARGAADPPYDAIERAALEMKIQSKRTSDINLFLVANGAGAGDMFLKCLWIAGVKHFARTGD